MTMRADASRRRSVGHTPASQQRRRTHDDWASKGGITLLVADPDANLCQEAIAALGRTGVRVTVSSDAADALIHVGRDDPDVILLPTDLPAIPLSLVLEAVRRQTDAVILLGSGTGDADGASAERSSLLLHRPFNASTILQHLENARKDIEARRSRSSRLSYGAIEIDTDRLAVHLAGRLLDLPVKEFDLLRALMQRPETVMSVASLQANLWGPDRPSSDALPVHISRLRARLRGHAEIQSIRGAGYRLTSAPESDFPSSATNPATKETHAAELP